MSDKRYTAEELREEANFHAFQHGNGYKVVEMLCQAANAEEEIKNLVEQNEKLNAWANELLLDREKLKARLEAVIKIASERHISREVKCKGLRLYVCIDGCTPDLDMGEVAKSLNSIGSILRVARGEGGAE